MSQDRFNPRSPRFGMPHGRQVTTAPARVRDHLGRVLEPGDEVLIVTPSILFRVAAISPVIHPEAPPNLMVVTLVCQTQVSTTRDGAVQDLYFMRHQAEIGDGLIAQPEVSEAPSTEAPDVEEPPPWDESGPADKPTVILTDYGE